MPSLPGLSSRKPAQDRTGRATIALLGAVLIVLVSGSVVLAQDRELQGKLRSGNEVVVPAGETVQGDF